ncbi:MAG: hypothetical protein ABL888_06630 [Pirellulaceae bacterium]
MSDNPETASVCTRCNLAQSSQHQFCARCGTPLNQHDNFIEIWEAKLAEQPQVVPAKKFPIHLTSLIGLGTLVLICIALFIVSPGLGIGITVLALPAVVRTFIVVQKQKSAGKAVGEGKTIYLFVASLGTTYVIAFVTFLATTAVFIGLGIILLFATCLTSVANPRNPGFDPEKMLLGIGLVSLLVAAAVLWSFSFWVRDRWRRDTKI